MALAWVRAAVLLVPAAGLGMWDLLPSPQPQHRPSARLQTSEAGSPHRGGFWGQILQHSNTNQGHQLQNSEILSVQKSEPMVTMASASVTPGAGSQKLMKMVPESLRSLHTIYTQYEDYDDYEGEEHGQLGQGEPRNAAAHNNQADQVLRTHQLTANTLSTLQKRFGPLPSEVPSPKKKMHPGINKEARTDADSLLDMIKSLQAEIKEIDKEIEKENSKVHNVNQLKKDVDGSVTQITKESSAETLRELILQKEEDKVQKVIAQMSLMKQIQKKEAENKKLEKALEKLNERKKLIHEALRRQKASADKKRKNAIDRLEKQARLLKERDRRFKSKVKSQENLPEESELFKKADMLEAHKLLVDKSNQRILQRIEEIKLSRQQEAIVEQERLVREQQMAINLLRQMQSTRNDPGIQESTRNDEQRVKLRNRKRPKVIDSVMSLAKQIQKARSTVELDPEDKKQVMEWMDLEKNAAILHKTDKAIANKLRSASDKSKEDKSDQEINELLGLVDMDDLPDILNTEDTSSDIDSSFYYDDYDDYDGDDYSNYYYDYDDYDDLLSDSVQTTSPSSNVQTMIERLPGGRVHTKVSIGLATPRPHIQRIGPQSHRPRSFSDLMMHS